jgi:FMN phosphatase YigB (HAD superfamily)
MDALDERELIWPQPPEPVPLRAKPTLQPLPDVRAVWWTVYGTLLTINDGELLHLHPEPIRNQIALEKTIEEFHMWFSMSRKPGQPWEYMLRQYERMVRQYEMAGTRHAGDFPLVNSSRIWERLIARLQQNEYTWDRGTHGDEADYADKVAYFFHANLQGLRPAPHAAETLIQLMQRGVLNGLLADTQPFTLAHLLKVLEVRNRLPSGAQVFAPSLLTLAHRVGVRKPSPSLYAVAVRRAHKAGLEPREVLHVSHRLVDDLSLAAEFGFRTALYAGDRHCCHVTREQLNAPDHKPDRLITDLAQVLDLVSG